MSDETNDYFDKIRKVHDRLDKMIALSENEDLTNALKVLKDELNYCPPEMIGNWLYKMNSILVSHIGTEPQPGWPTAVIDAYTK